MKAIGIAKVRLTPRQVGELLAIRLQLDVEVVILPIAWLALADAVRREGEAPAVVVTEGAEVAA